MFVDNVPKIPTVQFQVQLNFVIVNLMFVDPCIIV